MSWEESDTGALVSTSVRSSGHAGACYAVVIADSQVTMHSLPEAGEVTIGRASSSHLRIDHPSVSREHAILDIDSDLRVTDLGSANGTFLASVRLDPNEPATVPRGESVLVGSVTVLVQRRVHEVRHARIRTHDYFEARVGEECCRARRHADTFTVYRIQFDDLERTDDIGARLVQIVRDFDVVARYGPGAYELLITGSSVEESEASRLRVADELRQLDSSVRIGHAQYPNQGRDPDAMIAAAARPVQTDPDSEAGAQSHVVAEGAMQRLLRMAERVADSEISILILGETGVGKEVMAERIHACSSRRDKPLLKLNCAALSPSLLESELFGHERGAFTGAGDAKVGLLETADGGSVLLDEVGELPQSLQVKLLRVLEERAVLRVGSVKPRAIDVRFLAATNRDLEHEVEQGAFRRDLYYRLSGMPLEIPPLRDRRDEIESLATEFLAQAAKRSRKPGLSLSPDAVTLLEGYDWPGNIRELRNVIERVAILCERPTITAGELPVSKLRTRKLTGSPAVQPEPASVDADGLRQRIIDALDHCAGNQTRAARMLNVSRNTLMRWMDKYGLPRPRAGRAAGPDAGDSLD